jgi:Fe-S oxidoreductase
MKPIDEHRVFKMLPRTEGRVDKFLAALEKASQDPLFKLPLDLALNTCARCNNCAEWCPVYKATDNLEYLPARRSDLLRRTYKRYFTLWGRLLGPLAGAEDLTEGRLDQMAESFYRCTLCRRCAVECPMGIDNALIARMGRVLLSQELGIAPRILTESVAAHRATGNVSKIPARAFLDMVEFLHDDLKDTTGRDVPFPVDKEGVEMLVVLPVVDFLVEAETVMGIAQTLHAAGANWTFSSRLFDAVNFGVFYDDAALVDIAKFFVEEARKTGARTVVIGECGHAYKAARIFYDVLVGPTPFAVKHILEFTADAIRQGRLKLDPNKNSEPVTLHDPCNLVRMGGLLEQSREILGAACADFREMTPNREENYCCGGGGALVLIEELHDFRMSVAGKAKVEQIEATGAKIVVAPCANCKKQLRELVEYHKLNVAVAGVHDLVGKALVLEK